jgi:hypothetical protein
VHVLQCTHHRLHPRQDFRFGQRATPPGDDVAEAIAQHIVHHQELFARRLGKVIGNARQIGVIQPGQDICFALKLDLGFV